MSDAFDLQRFVIAQDPVYSSVLEELRQGRKQSHWMWFIFPQLKGLGRSAMADYYAISGREEAEEYFAHRVLGSRLTECTAVMNGLQNQHIEEILGAIDALKFRSSMTLFSTVASDPAPFRKALQKYFGGATDERTLHLLNRTG